MESTTAGDLVALLKEKFSYDADGARGFFEALAGVVKNALADGKEAVLPGFGSFDLLYPDGAPVMSTHKADLIADLVEALGDRGAEDVARQIAEVFSSVRARIGRGEAVPIPAFGTFAIVSRPPKVEKKGKSHKLVEPGRQELMFRAEEQVERDGVACTVVFRAAAEMESALGEREMGSVLLAMPENDEFSGMLAFYLKEAGWKTEIVHNIFDALARVDTGGAALVIIDAGLPDAQRFAQAMKLRRETNMIPLVMIYPKMETLLQPPGLLIMGDENIAEPFEIRALLDMVDAEVMRASEERLTVHQMVHLQMPTVDTAIEQAVDMFSRCVTVSGLADEQQVALSSAVKEALRNAADHGNKNKKEKKIELQYRLDAEKVQVTVRDYGLGFNHRQYIQRGKDGSAITAARERMSQGKMGGLGIMLMVRCTNNIEYNDIGNRVMLTRYLPGKDPA